MQFSDVPTNINFSERANIAAIMKKKQIKIDMHAFNIRTYLNTF